MTQKEIYDLLKTTNIPVVYMAWPEKEVPSLPYITFSFPQSDNFGADNLVYSKIKRLSVELYTANKAPATEAAVEAVLAQASTYWNVTEVYLSYDQVYLITYESEVIIDG